MAPEVQTWLREYASASSRLRAAMASYWAFTSSTMPLRSIWQRLSMSTVTDTSFTWVVRSFSSWQGTDIGVKVSGSTRVLSHYRPHSLLFLGEKRVAPSSCLFHKNQVRACQPGLGSGKWLHLLWALSQSREVAVRGFCSVSPAGLLSSLLPASLPTAGWDTFFLAWVFFIDLHNGLCLPHWTELPKLPTGSVFIFGSTSDPTDTSHLEASQLMAEMSGRGPEMIAQQVGDLSCMWPAWV